MHLDAPCESNTHILTLNYPLMYLCCSSLWCWSAEFISEKPRCEMAFFIQLQGRVASGPLRLYIKIGPSAIWLCALESEKRLSLLLSQICPQCVIGRSRPSARQNARVVDQLDLVQGHRAQDATAFRGLQQPFHRKKIPQTTAIAPK